MLRGANPSHNSSPLILRCTIPAAAAGIQAARQPKRDSTNGTNSSSSSSLSNSWSDKTLTRLPRSARDYHVENMMNPPFNPRCGPYRQGVRQSPVPHVHPRVPDGFGTERVALDHERQPVASGNAARGVGSSAEERIHVLGALLRGVGYLRRRASARCDAMRCYAIRAGKRTEPRGHHGRWLHHQ